MKKIAAFVVLCLPMVALAQSEPDSIVADTLDWHRYYPLEVGNVWEYEVSEGAPLLVHSIVDELIAQDHHYFVQQVTFWDYDYLNGGSDLEVFLHDTLFVRYSESGGVFEFSNIDADTLSSSDNNLAIYDLRSAFGDTVQIPQVPNDYYVVSGGFNDTIQISGFSYVPPAAKHFTSLTWFQSYAIDIGLLSSRNLWGPTLTYAKVSETEYGFSRVPTSIETEPMSQQTVTIEALYPNPVSDNLHIIVNTSRSMSGSIVVSNLVGQTISKTRLPSIPDHNHTIEIPVDTWPSGIYFVRLLSDDYAAVVRPVIKAR